MPLLRVSEKKLAANRANARLSKGPSTPEGKDRSSQNACKHHLYAKKHQLPAAWAARIQAVVAPCAASVENPIERARVVQYIFLKQWIRELDGYETRLLNQSIARHRNFNRGVHRFVTTNPLFHAIETRIQDLSRQAERARRDWESTRETILLAELTPESIQTKPLTMTANASISAEPPTHQPSVGGRAPSPARHPLVSPNLINSKPIMGRFLSIFLILLAATQTQTQAQPLPQKAFQSLQWRNIGPFRAGRTVEATGIPTDPNTFYIGVNGGVWKTTDAGLRDTPSGPEGPLALPGVYTVRLTAGGQTQTQKLTLRNDPRSPTQPTKQAIGGRTPSSARDPLVSSKLLALMQLLDNSDAPPTTQALAALAALEAKLK